MKHVQLPPNHHRSLSVVARAIEDSLDNIVASLTRANSQSILHHVEPSYTHAERAKILAAVDGVRRELAAFVDEFDLLPYSVTEAQILRAQCVHIWTLLQDSQSKAMKGYGDLEPEVSRCIDGAVGHLLELVDGLLALSGKPQ